MVVMICALAWFGQVGDEKVVDSWVCQGDYVFKQGSRKVRLSRSFKIHLRGDGLAVVEEEDGMVYFGDWSRRRRRIEVTFTDISKADYRRHTGVTVRSWRMVLKVRRDSSLKFKEIIKGESATIGKKVRRKGSGRGVWIDEL